MEDVRVVEKVLCPLTTTFDFVVCAIEESKDIKSVIVNNYWVHFNHMKKGSKEEMMSLWSKFLKPKLL